MADTTTKLAIELTAKNLTGPAFKEVQTQLRDAQGRFVSTGEAGKKAGTDIASGMDTAASSSKSAVSSISQGLGVAIPLSAAAAVTAIVAFGVDSVKAFTTLETNLRGVNTLFGLTGDASQKNFERMSKDIRAFSVRMGVDAVGATKALYDIVSSGVTKPAEAMKVLEVAQRAAIGGMTDAATTADGLTSILNAYGLGAEDATKISDQMFQTVNLGKITMAELSSGIGKVVPIAAALGIGFDQVGGALATMTKQGITAGAAFTDTQQILQQYLKPTAEAAELSKNLGLEFNATSVGAKGLQASLDKTGGNKELLARLFGSVEAVNGVLAVTGKNSQGASSDLDGVGKAAGASGAAFDEMDKSTQRSFDRMAAKAADLKVKIGSDLVGPTEHFLGIIDKIGVQLGLWPDDVPSKDQIGRFGDLAKQADNVVTAIKLLNAIIPAVAVGMAAMKINETITKPVTEASQASFDLAAQIGALRRELLTGAITQAQYEEKVTALNAAFIATRAAAATGRTEQQKLDDAYHDGLIDLAQYTKATTELTQAQADQAKNEAMGNQGKVDSLGLVQQQIDAALSQAATERKAAAEKKLADAAASQSAAERVRAAEIAAAAEKEAAAEAKRAAKAAADAIIAEAKRRAEAVRSANETATKSAKKLQEDVADIEADGGKRVQDIKDKHDHDYNQAIIDAQRDQARIFQDGANDRIHIEDEAGQRIGEVQSRLNDLEANRDDAAIDRRLQAERRAADQEVQDSQRASDRKLAIDRRAEDQRISDREKADDRELNRVKEVAAREQQIREDAAARKDIETGAGDSAAERKKAADRAASDAEKANDRDVAEAKLKLEEDLAEAAQKHTDNLADASSDDQRARIEREYAQEVVRINRQATVEANTRKERYDDEAEKRKERYDDEKDKADAQLKRDLDRADKAAKKRLDDLDAHEKEQKAGEDRADRREEAHRRLSDSRARDDLKTADDRDREQRRVQASRDETDWNAARKRAADALKDDIKKAEDKRDKEITASQEKEAAAIKASNDTLIAQQDKIDAQRDTDFGHFVEDLDRRFRELNQQFSRSMADLQNLIPENVARLIGGATNQTAAAAARLQAGITPAGMIQPMGAAGVYDLSKLVPTANPIGGPRIVNGVDMGPYNGEAGQSWYSTPEADNGPTESGDSFTPTPEQVALTDSWGSGGGAGDAAYDAILGTYRARLKEINQAYEQALIGGDSATAAGKMPPLTVQGASTGQEAIAWAEGRLGSRDFNGMCERFVEMAHGTSGVFASAAAAAAALQRVGGRMEDAPRGALVFFRPDGSNGGFGHVGIAEGNGRFISATNGGVTIDGPSAYWSRLYSGYGAPNFPRRQYGGALRAGQPAIVGENGREVIIPDQDSMVLPNSAIRRGGGTALGGGMGDFHLHVHVGTMIGGDAQRVASDLAPYIQGALDRQVRLRMG